MAEGKYTVGDAAALVGRPYRLAKPRYGEKTHVLRPQGRRALCGRYRRASWILYGRPTEYLTCERCMEALERKVRVKGR